MKDNLLKLSGIKPGTAIYKVEKLEEKKALVVRGKKKYSSGVIIYMEKKNIYMWLNNCPHANLNLDLIEGKVQSYGGKLLCANHGAKFDPKSGKCVKGPCKNKNLEKFPFYIKKKYLIAK